jgi:hypothetical protein
MKLYFFGYLRHTNGAQHFLDIIRTSTFNTSLSFHLISFTRTVRAINIKCVKVRTELNIHQDGRTFRRPRLYRL